MTVYFIRQGDNGPVKIGYTRAPIERRHEALRTTAAAPLHLLRTIDGYRKTERWLHELFSEKRVEREWFVFDEEMLRVQPPAWLLAIDQPPHDKRSETPPAREGRFKMGAGGAEAIITSALRRSIGGQGQPSIEEVADFVGGTIAKVRGWLAGTHQPSGRQIVLMLAHPGMRFADELGAGVGVIVYDPNNRSIAERVEKDDATAKLVRALMAVAPILAGEDAA
jgi:hypothetical protein